MYSPFQLASHFVQVPILLWGVLALQTPWSVLVSIRIHMYTLELLCIHTQYMRGGGQDTVGWCLWSFLQDFLASWAAELSILQHKRFSNLLSKTIQHLSELVLIVLHSYFLQTFNSSAGNLSSVVVLHQLISSKQALQLRNGYQSVHCVSSEIQPAFWQ